MNWADLPPDQLQRMGHAVEEIAECHRVLAKSGLNLVGEVLRGFGEFTEYDHYPPDDAYDGETHAQYYFHAHAPEPGRPADYGHFHVFLRPKGMPEGMAPDDSNEALCHLIAISMNSDGLPVRLFTTNRWVTAEHWYDAEDAIRCLDHARFDIAWPSWPLNRWLTAMLVLYRPQIESLIRERDRVVSAWREAHPDRDVFEDRELAITSSLEISLGDTVSAFADFWEAHFP
jgi:hypothetical protein